jgi:ceramide glucosyltransferase
MLHLVLLGFSSVATAAHVTSTGISLLRRAPSRAPCPETVGAKVSVVRPACGIDDLERAALASSFDLDNERVEILFCCAHEDDAAVPWLRELIGQHAEFEAHVCVGDSLGTANPKLNNMANGWRAARHPWVLFADSNLLLPPDYVDRVLAAWRPDTGVVCLPPIGTAPVGFWSELECAFLNTSQARWQLTVDALGFAFAQGKTMLFRRVDLESFGGMAALATELAEDAAATKHVRASGRRVRLADPVVGQPLGHRSSAQVLERQLRWAQLRRITFPLYYVPELLGGCVLPIAAGVAAMRGEARLSVLVVLATLWLGCELVLALRWRWPVSWRSPFAWLARDLLTPVIWILGWTTHHYRWRGNEIEIFREPDLSEQVPAPPHARRQR